MKEPRIHSPEWFKARIAETKAQIEELPPWAKAIMQSPPAVAAFPK